MRGLPRGVARINNILCLFILMLYPPRLKNITVSVSYIGRGYSKIELFFESIYLYIYIA